MATRAPAPQFLLGVFVGTVVGVACVGTVVGVAWGIGTVVGVAWGVGTVVGVTWTIGIVAGGLRHCLLNISNLGERKNKNKTWLVSISQASARHSLKW